MEHAETRANTTELMIEEFIFAFIHATNGENQKKKKEEEEEEERKKKKPSHILTELCCPMIH